MIANLPTEESEIKEQEGQIESDTFTPTGKRLGLGCWGIVEEYTDPTGNRWAIKRFSPNETAKRQMTERGWTEERVMRSEALPLDAAQHNVVPRIIERDKNGKLFVGMPVYQGTLEGRKWDLTHGKEGKPDLERILEVTRNIANGLSYLHGRGAWYEDSKAHGDVKPTNILMKGSSAFLGDLGSSTCISISGEASPRGTHGDINYRAPECSDSNARPSQRADIWSLGAILYELTTGKGIYDGLQGPNHDPKELRSAIRGKIKDMPRALRKFTRKCLEVDPSKRFASGWEAKDKLEEVIENRKGFNSLKKYLKWTLPLAASVAMISFAGYQASTYEPQKLEMPSTQKVVGMLYPEVKPGQQIEFEAENIPFDKKGPLGLVGNGLSHNAKISTDNRVVAYLTKAYAQAQMETGGFQRGGYNEYQFRTYMANTTPDDRGAFNGLHNTPWPIWAKSIEVAINQSKTKNAKIDLEDTMAITILGTAPVLEAKRVSGSQDWKDYKGARNSKGEYIIPEKDSQFIGTWLAYFHSDVD